MKKNKNKKYLVDIFVGGISATNTDFLGEDVRSKIALPWDIPKPKKLERL